MADPQPVLKVDSPIAKEIEGYLSIDSDLHYVMRITHGAVQFLESGREDDFTLPTYLSAALVAYARPFKDGVRGTKKLNLNPEEIYNAFEGATQLHEYLIDQRDKLVAHSVNPFEVVSVGLVLDNQGKPAGAGYLSSRLISFTIEDYKQFNHLSKIALEFVNDKTAALEKQLMEEAKTLSKDELSKLKPLRHTTPNPAQASQSRRNAN